MELNEHEDSLLSPFLQIFLGASLDKRVAHPKIFEETLKVRHKVEQIKKNCKFYMRE
jgi:hypothetical protein